MRKGRERGITVICNRGREAAWWWAWVFLGEGCGEVVGGRGERWCVKGLQERFTQRVYVKGLQERGVDKGLQERRRRRVAYVKGL